MITYIFSSGIIITLLWALVIFMSGKIEGKIHVGGISFLCGSIAAWAVMILAKIFL